MDPSNIIWVAKSDGDFTSISDALASITDLTERYLIKVGPGTYDEPAGIDMKGNVDIEGSGQRLTTISRSITTELPGADSNPPSGAAATVRFPGGESATLRSLTVTSTVTVPTDAVGTWNAVGIYASGDSGQVIENVDVLVDGATAGAAALRKAGIVIVAGAPRIDSVFIRVFGSGFANLAVYTDSGLDATRITTFTFGSGFNYDIYNPTVDPPSPLGTNVVVRSSQLGSPLGLFQGPSLISATQLAQGPTGPDHRCVGSFLNTASGYQELGFNCLPIPTPAPPP